jgi:hypothetical protein
MRDHGAQGKNRFLAAVEELDREEAQLEDMLSVYLKAGTGNQPTADINKGKRKFWSNVEGPGYTVASCNQVDTHFCTKTYKAGPQSKFPTRPTASKPYIARSDRAYVIEQ